MVEALHGGADHISAEEIYDQVRARYLYANISTVYRTLELLKELGLVTETELGDGRVRYHPAEKGHHHHLICQKCGSVIDLPEAALSGVRRRCPESTDFWPACGIWRYSACVLNVGARCWFGLEPDFGC